MTIAVPAIPKPTPTDNPADLGKLQAVKNSDGTYTSAGRPRGDTDFTYYKLDGQPYRLRPACEMYFNYWACLDNSTTSVTIKVDPGTWNVNVEAVYFPDSGAAAAARTHTL